MRTTLRAAIALAAVLLLATACGSKSGATADAGTPLTIAVTINGSSITPNGTRIDAAVGQKIVLHVTSDTAHEIHVHSGGAGQPIEVAKGTHDYSFTIDRPGTVEVEVEELKETLFQLEVR
ncbi:MAG TPA: hypothetical protein VN088_02695 [Nocardioides sp.]|nr:hypothetical protein [Nocardioides sp.]